MGRIRDDIFSVFADDHDERGARWNRREVEDNRGEEAPPSCVWCLTDEPHLHGAKLVLHGKELF